MQWFYILSTQWSNVSESNFMIRNIWIFLVEIYYKMKEVANINLKSEIVLICCAFDIRNQDERIL